ncbi:MAG: hypothetical protein WCY81_04990 [Sphaerochaetaceae bacterium]
MKLRQIILLLVLMFLILVPLSSMPLESIMKEAKHNSSSMQLIELSRSQNNVTIALRELDDELFVGVEGETSYSMEEQEIKTNPSVTIVLPNDGDTTITLSTGDLTVDTSQANSWEVYPDVSVSHTLHFGDVKDVLSDLTLARNKLSFEQAYQKSLLGFEDSLYTKIIELLSTEKTMLINEKNLYVKQTDIDNDRKLGKTAIGSVAYQKQELDLASLKLAKERTLQQYELQKRQYFQLTSLEWDGVDTIKEASLAYRVSPLGDTSVVIASLDLEIAKEQLKQQQHTSQYSTRPQVPQLNISGGGGLGYKQTGANSSSYSYKAEAGVAYEDKSFGSGLSFNYDSKKGSSFGGSVSYYGKNFTTTGSVNVGLTKDWDVKRPTFTIKGEWNNGVGTKSDTLKLQSASNDVATATLQYQNAMLDYQLSSQKLESDVLSFTNDIAQLKEQEVYVNDSLAKTIEAFDRGLVRQTDVDLARLEVELLSYDKKIQSLNALILENRVKALQL